MKRQLRTTNDARLFVSIVSSLYGMAIVCGMRDAWHMTTLSPYMLGVVPLTIFLLLYFKLPQRRYFYRSVIVLFFVTLPVTMRGVTSFYNEAVAFIGRERGFYFKQFEKEGFVDVTALLLLFFFAVALVYFAQKQWRVPYACLLVAYVLPQLVFGIAPALVYNALVLCLAFLLMCMPRFWTKKACVSIGVATGCVVLLLCSARFLPSVQSPVQERVKQVVHTWQYGENTTDFLREGQMTKLGAGDMTKQVVLSVMMEQPTALYLRGFVGARYENDTWQSLSTQDLYDAQPLLRSLQHVSFNSDRLLSQAYTQAADSERSTVHIYVKNGSLAYRFTPYELASSTNTPAASFLDDGMNAQTMKTKTDHYTYAIEPKAVVHYPLTSLEQRSDDYLAAEGHYNVFAYNYYTKLTKEDAQLLTSHIGKPPKTRMTYAQSIKKVKAFLSKEMRYDLQTKKVPKDANFLQYTLEQTKRGYSPHYATLATLAFRHFGIPARYVEGYTVTNELVDGKQPLAEIQVTGKEAHAWTEIYIDQLGWVPVEVTPGFEKKMPQLESPLANTMPQSAESTSQQTTQAQGEQAGTQQQVTEPKQTIDPAPKKEKTEWPQSLTYIFALLAFLLICASYVWWQRRTIRKLRKQMNGADAKAAAIATRQLVEWQLRHIKKWHTPQPSVHALVDVVDASYEEALRQLLTAYQASLYGGEAVDLLAAYEKVKATLIEETPRLKRIYFFFRGWM